MFNARTYLIHISRYFITILYMYMHSERRTEYEPSSCASDKRILNGVHFSGYIFTVNSELRGDHFFRESCHACLLVKAYMYIVYVHVQ